MEAHPNAPESDVIETTPIAPDVLRAEERITGDVVAGHAAVILEHVRPEWLLQPRNRRILERAASLLAHGAEVDLVTLCEGQERDFMLYASTVIDGSMGGTNAKSLARIIERDWRRRETASIGRALSNGSSREPEKVRELADKLNAVIEPSEASSRISDVVISGISLMTADLPPVDPLLGTGVLIRRGLAIMVGHSGMGKTFLALQLLRSIASGEPWLNLFATPTAGLRVGLLQLEMPAASIRDRLRPIGGEWLSRLSLLCMPDFSVDITSRETQDEIIHWCLGQKIELLVVDPFNQTHNLEENSGRDMALAMNGWKRVRSKANASMLLLHHVTKTSAQESRQAEATPHTMVLNMVRGSGRLSNDPDTIIGLLEAPGSRVKLVFAKTRHTATPPDQFLTRDEHGYFQRGEAIQTARAHSSEDKIERYLLGRGSPATIAEIGHATGMTDRGAKKRLVAMNDRVEIISGRPTRYGLRTGERAEQFDFVSDEETETNAEDF